MSPGNYARTRVAPGIYRRPSGRYEAFTYYQGRSYPAGTHDTINEAKLARAARLHALKEATARAAPPTPATTTFAAWAENWWQRVRQRFKPSTARAVRSHLDRHLLPALGRFALANLKPYVVETALLAVAPTKSPKYRRNIYQTAQWVLQDAARNGLLAGAPQVPLPRVPVRRVQAVAPEDVARILAAMASPLREAATLAFLTGLREGELLALTWDAVDLDRGTLTVTVARDQSGVAVSPKSDAAVRTIPLSTATVAFLRAYRDRQAEDRRRQLAALDERGAARRPRRADTVRAGKAAQRRQHLTDPELARYLFPVSRRASRRHGRLPVLDDSRLRKALTTAAATVGLKLRWHDLRHSMASALLASGGEGVLPVLAAILGHSSTAFTLHQYAHMIPSRVQPFLDAFDVAVGFAPSNAASEGATEGGEGSGSGGDAATSARSGELDKSPE